MEKIAPATLGLLLIVIEIRTPWTLANPEIWRKTHRRGGKLFLFVGELLAVTAWSGASWLLLPAVLVVGVVPVAYSYWLSRQGTAE